MKDYPMDATPPITVKAKIEVAEQSTPINAIRFSGKSSTRENVDNCGLTRRQCSLPSCSTFLHGTLWSRCDVTGHIIYLDDRRSVR